MSKHYDVIIVGGGVTGAIMAKILSQGGKNILLLEAGVKGAMDPENYRNYLNTLYTEGGIRGMPNGPYPWNAAAPSPAIPTAPPNGEEDPYFVFKTEKHFMSDYLRMLGGTTLHWQGTSLRMVPHDFKMKTVYGKGLDWPITYDDLEPAYRRAEYEMGVCADVEDQRFFAPFAEGYVYPMHKMPQSRVDQFFKKTIENKIVTLAGDDYKMKVISIPVARNSTPNAKYKIGEGYEPVSAVGNRDSGLRCQGNSSCMPICPVQAKYSALKTLNELNESGKVEIRTQCVVSRIIVDKKTKKISEVEYKHYQNSASSKQYTLHKVKGTIVVLAANAIENATLLLASKAANNSDQVGRNLMDHPYLYTWGYSREKRVYPFRGPDTTSGMESLRDGNFRKVHASFRASLSNWGWSGEPGGQLSSLMEDKVYGKKLRHELGDRMTRMVKVGFMVEQLPNPENRVTIDKSYKDDMGNNRPVLSYGYDDYSLAGLEAAVTNIWKNIRYYAKIDDKTDYPDPAPGGYQRVKYNGKYYNIMGSGHIVGTHRMGSSPKDSVTDRNMKSWDHPNLYVVGPGNQVTIGTANPTLTTAALAVRASEAILKQL